MSNTNTSKELLSSTGLRKLYHSLGQYAAELKTEQPLAAQVVELVRRWVEYEDRFDQ